MFIQFFLCNDSLEGVRYEAGRRRRMNNTPSRPNEIDAPLYAVMLGFGSSFTMHIGMLLS